MNKVFQHNKRISIFILSLLLTGAFFTQGAPADSGTDKLVLRIHIQPGDDAEINVSVPLNLLETLHKSLPGDVRDEIDELGPSPSAILKELKTLGGNDLIRIEGEESVRIWVEEVKNKSDEALKFITVQVKESGNEKNKINLCIPVGLVSLFAESAKGIIENGELNEKFFPPELKKLLKELKKLEDL